MHASIRHPKYFYVIILGILSIPVLLSPTAARGGLLAGDLNAMDGWQGTLAWTGSTDPNYPPVKYLYANIDYAVYAPGYFDDTFTTWDDPSDGTQYVYAYQLFNDPHVPPSDDTHITSFTVGVHSDEQTADVYLGYLDDPSTTNDKNPTSWAWSGTPIATSIVGLFKTVNRIGLNYRSKFLYFTSEYGPREDFTNIIGYPSGCTDLENQYRLPSPMPEPATALILVIAGGMFILMRKLRRYVFA